jgi:hypothetical protein
MHGEESHLDQKYTVMTHTGGMPGSAALFSNLRSKENSIWLVYLNNGNSHPNDFTILDQAKIKY